jgi:PAS domain S-box-containing protein
MRIVVSIATTLFNAAAAMLSDMPLGQRATADAEQAAGDAPLECSERETALLAEIEALQTNVALSRRSLDRFAKAFRSDPDALVIARLSDGAIMEVNQSWERIVGYQAAEVLGKDRSTLRIVTDDTVRSRLLERLIHFGSYRDEDVQFRLRSGAIRDMRMSAETIDIDGEVCALTRIRDVTAQKEAERALRASDDRLSMALAAATMGIWEWIISTGEVIWSKEAGLIFGLAEGGTVGTLDEFLSRVHPDDRPAIRGRFAELTERLHAGQLYDGEYRVVWPSGDVRWVAAKGRVDFDSSGAAIRMLGTVMDVTQRKQTEDKAQDYLADLWRMARIRTADQTASSLAHELNQPLTAIAIQAGIASSLAAASDNASSELAVPLKEISEQAQRAGGIIRSLRDFVKRGDARREPVRINDLVREVVVLVEPLARRRHVQIALQLGDVPAIGADRIQIAQAVMNLLQNALDALDLGESTGRRLEIATRHDGRQVEITVADTGPGIPAMVGERIFERFYTTKSEGIGLGLAICRSIVEAHAGTLQFSSVVGTGTTFSIRLPVAEPSEQS